MYLFVRKDFSEIIFKNPKVAFTIKKILKHTIDA